MSSELELNDEAVQSIADLAQAAAETEITRLPGGLMYHARSGNAVRVERIPAPLRRETLATPLDLGAFIEAEYAKTDETLADAPTGVENLVQHPNGKIGNAATFLDEDEAVFAYDLNDVRTFAACPLKLTEVWKLLQSIHNTKMDQFSFVRLLRITLRGCLGQAAIDVLNTARRVRFDSNGTVSGVAEHQRQSMAKSLIAEVAPESQFPEEFTLNVQVFENYPFTVNVECALELLAQDAKFVIVPYPLELRKAMDITLHQITKVLSGENMPPVYRGKPTQLKAEK